MTGVQKYAGFYCAGPHAKSRGMILKISLSDIAKFAGLLQNAVIEPFDFSPSADLSRIINREKDMLQQAAFGKTSGETAAVLDLSERFVEILTEIQGPDCVPQTRHARFPERLRWGLF
ncbi:hypothetical protein QEZ52_21700 (plasmid) [Aliisedimentitalea scapharcae]|uniref:Uncharacterized protein n=1 Tax=Aliisedimentitalea scapharcae TaxID=1524259 RepID=A0ABZ2XYI1_9RHOB